MATEYLDGTAFTTARQHGDLILDRPLTDVGDATALVIYRTMRILSADYAPVSRGTALAGFTGSRLIRETQPEEISTGVWEFKQIYATKPANRSDVFSGSISFPFPSTQGVYYTPPATAESADESDDNLWEYREEKTAVTNPGVLYIDYVYFLEASPPTIATVFKSSEPGFVSNGGSGSVNNAKALNGDVFTGTYSVSATTPSATAYATSITDGDLLNVDVRISRYMGDIFVMETHKTAAK
jgi:hypothetical protein